METCKKKTKYELIAPAGSLEKAKYALRYGADSVYLGIPDFSLRVRINKFDEKGVKEIIDYAHKEGKKVYITANIYAHNKHLKNLPKYLRKIQDWGADGIIISDPGIIRMAKKHCPKMPIHLSTQANCTNYEAAKFWFDLGIKRIVLGREVTLEEIKEIHKKIPKLELEYFAHGAMCMSYSGRCLLSSFFVGRSANLGDCVQPCRWEYEVSQKSLKSIKSKVDCGNNIYIKAKGHPEALEIEEDRQGSYILNSKDLALVKYLNELKEAGVTSFKIEGRAKSIYYVSIVSKIYRQALDMKSRDKKELNKLFKELQTLTHREYTTGFLFGREKVEQKYDSSHLVSDIQFVGEVVKVVNQCHCEELATKQSRGLSKKYNSRYIYAKVHNVIFLGDNIEVIQPRGDKIKMKIKEMYDSNGEPIKEAHGGQGKVVLIKVNRDIEKMSLLRKTKGNRR